jgi:hypothetical protein
MPFVLTNAHTPQCLHLGNVTKTTASKLVIQGNAALTSVGPVTSCPVVATMAQPTLVKCTTVTVAPAGKATKLKVGGTPVLLNPLAATADAPPANPGGALSCVPPATPTKVSAV